MTRQVPSLGERPAETGTAGGIGCQAPEEKSLTSSTVQFRPSAQLRSAEPSHFAVTVWRNGEEIVTIESNCLSGREISREDEETIETAARHLLAFIGRHKLRDVLAAV